MHQQFYKTIKNEAFNICQITAYFQPRRKDYIHLIEHTIKPYLLTLEKYNYENTYLTC